MKTKKLLGIKGFIPAVAMVVASATMLGGVSYAWFTSGTEAQVSSITMTIDTADAVQYSLGTDTLSWQSSDATSEDDRPIWDSSAITAAGGKVATTMLPVSTDATQDTTTGLLSFVSNPTADGGDSLVAYAPTTSSSTYLMTFEFYARATTSTTIDMTELTLSGTKGAEKAVRIAFVTLGTYEAEEDRDLTATYDQTSKAAIDEDLVTSTRAVNIFQPNATQSATGSKTAEVPYGTSEATPAAPTVPAVPVSLASITTNWASNSDANEAFTACAGITRVQAYVWIEGTDAECTNAIAVDQSTISIAFTLEKSTRSS